MRFLENCKLVFILLRNKPYKYKYLFSKWFHKMNLLNKKSKHCEKLNNTTSGYAKEHWNGAQRKDWVLLMDLKKPSTAGT